MPTKLTEKDIRKNEMWKTGFKVQPEIRGVE